MNDPFNTNDSFNSTPASMVASRPRVQVDAGLRNYMQSVYNRMTMGLAITSIVAFLTSNSPGVMQFIFGTPLVAIALMLSPLAVVWFGFNPARMNSGQLRASFMLLSVLYGLSFSVIFIAYVPADIVRALLMTTIMFAGLSIFGYTTKRDLTALGTFAYMAMLGLLAFSVLYMLGTAFSLVQPSSGINDLVSIATILIFAGLTAWDTQNIKSAYNPSYGNENNSRMAWVAALNLYISFIAMFQSLLQLLGNRE